MNTALLNAGLLNVTVVSVRKVCNKINQAGIKTETKFYWLK